MSSRVSFVIMTDGTYDVKVDEQLIGNIIGPRGFYTDSMATKLNNLVLEPEDLRAIASRIDTVRGVEKGEENGLGVCSVCGGSPRFPQITDQRPYDMELCEEPIHDL